MDITYDKLEQLFDHKLDPINLSLDAMQRTLDAHTTTLDLLVKQTKDWNVEMTVMRNRMERYETALNTIAAKLNLDPDALLGRNSAATK